MTKVDDALSAVYFGHPLACRSHRRDRDGRRWFLGRRNVKKMRIEFEGLSEILNSRLSADAPNGRTG